MPKARDRLGRAVDITPLYTQRHSLSLGTYQDSPELNVVLFGSPSPRANSRARNPLSVGGRGSFASLGGTPGVLQREILLSGSARRGRGRGRAGLRNSLPSWYPRRPIHDITAIVRAIERRRELLRGEEDGQEIGTPMLPIRRVSDTSEATPSTAAHLEHGVNPLPDRCSKPACSVMRSVPQILLDITNKASGDSEVIIPQKKLLDSIDTAQKDVMEELWRHKRTPSAKRAEREKRVRTLMSMR